jgi:hypothetical protein
MEPQAKATLLNPVPSPQVVKEQLVKKFSGGEKKNNVVLVVIALVVVLAGIGTGYLFSGKRGSSSKVSVPGVTNTAKEAGMADEKTFKDSATGIMKSGGIAGEGTHHLERDGGPSQYVYLTSTVIDMESFVDKKVQVWGQTISAKKAGWLMDVGKLKVID